MGKHSINRTEDEIKTIDTEQKALGDQVSVIENNIMKLHTETKKKMEEIVNKVSEHKTIEKTSANLLRQGNQIAVEVGEKQIELETLENEMARVKLDILNTESQLIMLENRRRGENNEREEKEALVTKYENKIRENHDTHEKKMHDVAKYNREKDKASQQQNIYSKGPTEAGLIFTKKETAELSEKIKQLQGEFIKSQTLYVKNEKTKDKLQEQITQLKRKETILMQKKLRLNQQYNQHNKEIDRIKNALKNSDNEMKKLNEYLAANYESAKVLQNANININSEFIEKLKELEKESVKLEVEIDRLKEEKAELLSEIEESERQILLWERKIQLEKEMQEQLDPNVGQHDIKNLRKQIHIMELQLDDIRKKQDQLIIEIERSVYKRESIQLKYTNKNKSSDPKDKTKGNPTQIAKNIQILKATINEATKHLKEMDSNLKTKEIELNNMNNQKEKANEDLAKMEYDVQRNIEEILELKVSKYLGVFSISSIQTAYKQLEDCARKGKVHPASEGVKNKLLEQVEVNKK